MKTNRRAFLRMTGALGAGAFVIGDNSIELVAQASRALGDRSADDVARDEFYWREIQSAFSLDRSLINLNNGNSCPSPTVVHEAYKRYLDYSNQAPVFHRGIIERNIEVARRRLAAEFGCDPEEMAITRNSSESLQIAQNGLDLEPGDEVLTTEQDYGRISQVLGQLTESRIYIDDTPALGVLEMRVWISAPRFSREREEGLGGDEALGPLGQDRVDVMTRPNEHANERARLVDSDPAGDADQDACHGVTSSSPAPRLDGRIPVRDLPTRDLLHGHREVVLRAGLDQGRRSFLEAHALAELVVIVVDLARALGSDDDEGVAGVDLLQQLVDAGMDHGRLMVPASASSHSTIADSAAVARSRSSFRTM